MNERTIVAMVIGVFAVLVVLLAWAGLYPSKNWDTVAQGVAGAIIFVVVFAIVVGTIIGVAGRR